MSCDGNRHKYFQSLASQPAIQAALNLDEKGVAFMLERLYQLGRSAGMARLQFDQNDADLATETELTKRLFARMQAQNIKPPTHSADGLPKKEARFGYGQIERVLRAIEKGEPLPEVARSIAAKVTRGVYGSLGRMSVSSSGAISAVGYDSGGYYRCANCGRFASQRYGHVCPKTASAADLVQMLHRRTGVPTYAFRGYETDALGALLEEARANGDVVMVHLLTGHQDRVTLDGIPQAMLNGFVPRDWKDHVVPVFAPYNNMNVIGVLNAEGMERAVEDISAVHALAQYYGYNMPPDAPVLNAYDLVSTRTPLQQVAVQSNVSVEGGQTYDLDHFIGTEYRKKDARGTFVEIGGKRYGVYARSQDPRDRSSARGRYATQTDNIVIGRTLPAAIGILAEAEVSEANGKIEVYDKNGQLLSVYDPATRSAGDTRGSLNASPEQMAAVLAHRFLNPQTAFDYALIQDFLAFKNSGGSPIAAADSGYLALRYALEHEGALQLGARLGVQRCPQCGQFIGSGAHACPGGAKARTKARRTGRKKQPEPAPVQVEAKQAEEPVTEPVEPAAEPAAAEPVVDVTPQPSAQQIAPQQSVNVTVSLPDQFAEDLGQVLADILKSPAQEGGGSGAAWRSNDRLDAILTQIAALLAAQQEMLQKMSQTPAQPVAAVGGAALDVEGLSERLAATIARNVPAPVIVSSGGDGAPVTVARPRTCPRCGGPMSDDHQCPPRRERQGLQRPPGLPQTEFEQALSGITMPAPDLYLDSVPAEWGGQRAVPLPENIPDLNTEYEMGQQERTILNMIALQLRKKSKKPTNRAFGLYGPAGTGKNTIARMLAASLKCDDGKQGLPYNEVNITPDMDIAQAIGEVVLTTDENGQTVSRVRLGPIGLTAASGGVVAINEIVRSPKLATALQSIIEDGEISIPSPEGGTYKVPVHPSAIFITTWNPGYEGDADRPAQAFLSRITAMPLPYPSREEQKRRVRAYFSREGLEQPPEEILDAAVDFWSELRLLTGATGKTPQIGAYSPTRTTPGPRELSRFVEYGMQAGWENALMTLEVICDQDPEQKETQVNILRDRFVSHFGGVIGAVAA
jgi:hypothetical protein